MRYHELAKELGVEPEILTAAAGEKLPKAPVAVSNVTPELEVELRARFGPKEPAGTIVLEEVTGALEAVEDEAFEEREHPGHEGEMVAIEGKLGEWNELSSDGPGEALPLVTSFHENAEAYAAEVAQEVLEALPDQWLHEELPEGYEEAPEIAALDEVDFVAKYGYDEEEVEAVKAGLEVVPADQRFAVVDEFGNFLETLRLDPGQASKVQALLDQAPGRKVGGYCEYPESGLLQVVTFPDGQIHRVWRDE